MLSVSDSFLRFIQLVSDWIVTFLYPVPDRVVDVIGETLPDLGFPPPVGEIATGGDIASPTFITFGGRGLVVVDDGVDGRIVGHKGIEHVGGDGFGTDDDKGGVKGRGFVANDDGVGGSGFVANDDGVGGSGFVANDDGVGGSGFVIDDDGGGDVLTLDVDDVIDLVDDVIDAVPSSSTFPSVLSAAPSPIPSCFSGKMELLSPRVTVPTFRTGLELVALGGSGTCTFLPSSSLTDIDRALGVGFMGLCE